MASYRAQMKKLIEDLRYAQLQYRLSLYSLTTSKIMVWNVARKMRKLQKEHKNAH